MTRMSSKIRDILCIFTCLTVTSIVLFLITEDEYMELEDQFFQKTVENRSGIADKSSEMEMYENEYCIGYNFLESSESFHDNLEPVSLITHTTPDMLKTLESIPKMWDGPISIGLFLDVQSQNSLIYLRTLHKCLPDFRKKVSVHLAYRTTPFQKSCDPIFIPESTVSCRQFLSYKDSLLQNIPGPFSLYPYSLMRNIARKGAKSDIHFIMDGDMILSEGIAQRIKKIANEMIDGRQKNVLLVRRFENEIGTVIPKNAKGLLESLEGNRTFEFHHKFYSIGHKIEDLDSWLQYSLTSPEITSWPIPYTSDAWEPQPILHRNDPYNAVYFPSRLKNMQSLIYKLCRANYTFHVLSHVFNVHEGIKTTDKLYFQAVAEHQKFYSRDKAQARFSREMDSLYPATSDTCGGFNI